MKQRILPFLTVAALALGLGGCGHYPSAIHSVRDIHRTASSEYMVVVGMLPLEDWPKLQKFAALEHLGVLRNAAAAVTDRHIGLLGGLNLPQLKQVSLADCRNVTDEGIQFLTNLGSIEGLQLIGTSITDRGLDALATRMPKVSDLNVMNCRLLTPSGFLRLKDSATIKSVGLSVDPLSQAQVEDIIAHVSNVTWWTISDPRRQLDHRSLKSLGESRKITIHVVDENKVVTEIAASR